MAHLLSGLRTTPANGIISGMKKFRIVTLGCRTNQYESQLFSDQLRRMGYVQVREDEEADLCIANTCSVTDQADAASRHQIRNLLRRHSKARFIVTGCMAESAPDALRSIDQRIEIVPNQDKEKLVDLLFPFEPNSGSGIERFDGHTRAFVKVQDGCNSFCTYCIVPYLRGRSRSRPVQEVLKEVGQLALNGYREIVLTGINIGDYEDDGLRLADLVRAVDRVQGIERLRISSIDPNEVDEDLIETLLNGLHTCPNLHLVLQSGSNVVLKRMNRKYSRQLFLDTVERLVRRFPDFTVTTDIIVGFPGESEIDFAETIDIVQQVKFAKVHIFPYSVRSRTRAALFKNPVSADTIGKRKAQLQAVAERSAFELQARFVGRTMNVLLEAHDEKILCGHTANFLFVQVPRGSHRPNELVSVEILENSPSGLRGRIH